MTFLVIHQKHKKSLEEITNDLCPVLSVQQLYRISTMYWDDRYKHRDRLTRGEAALSALQQAGLCSSSKVMIHQSLCTFTMCWVDNCIIKIFSREAKHLPPNQEI